MTSPKSLMRSVLLGPPNSGKGVAGEYLTLEKGIPCVSTGQLLRAEVTAGTAIGLSLKAELEKGHFAPDEIVQGLVRQFLVENDCFALDGFPRNVAQARYLDDELASLNKGLNIVIHLHTDDSIIIERAVTRLTCSNCRRVTSTRYTQSDICGACGGKLFRRADDNEETVRERLDVYKEQTQPLIDFYSTQGLLVTLSAGGSIPDLYQKLDVICKKFIVS